MEGTQIQLTKCLFVFVVVLHDSRSTAQTGVPKHNCQANSRFKGSIKAVQSVLLHISHRLTGWFDLEELIHKDTGYQTGLVRCIMFDSPDLKVIPYTSSCQKLLIPSHFFPVLWFNVQFICPSTHVSVYGVPSPAHNPYTWYIHTPSITQANYRCQDSIKTTSFTLNYS